MTKLVERVKNAGRVAVATGALAYMSGCGLGAYAKDPRAGYMWDSMAQGAWQHEVAREGRSNVNQTVIVQGNGYQPPTDSSSKYIIEKGGWDPVSLRIFKEMGIDPYKK